MTTKRIQHLVENGHGDRCTRLHPCSLTEGEARVLADALRHGRDQHSQHQHRRPPPLQALGALCNLHQLSQNIHLRQTSAAMPKDMQPQKYMPQSTANIILRFNDPKTVLHFFCKCYTLLDIIYSWDYLAQMLITEEM